MKIDNIIEQLKKNNYNFKKTFDMLFDIQDLENEINYFKKNNMNYVEYKKNEIEYKLKDDVECRFFYGNIKSVYTVEQYELVSANIMKKEDINLEDTVRYNNDIEKYLPIRLENTKLNEINNEYDINIISPLLYIKDEKIINDILNMKQNDILKIISVKEEIEEGRCFNVVKDMEVVKYNVKNKIISGVNNLSLHVTVKDIVSEISNDNFYHDKNLTILKKDITDSFLVNCKDKLNQYNKDIVKFFDHFDKCVNQEKRIENKQKKHKLVQKQDL